MRRVVVLLAIAFMLSASSANACSFHADCEPGSKCVKAAGSIDGVCVGGSSPGNSNDSSPYRRGTDADGTYGASCAFDSECGVRNRCVKSAYAIIGVCMTPKK